MKEIVTHLTFFSKAVKTAIFASVVFLIYDYIKRIEVTYIETESYHYIYCMNRVLKFSAIFVLELSLLYFFFYYFNLKL